MKRIIAAFLIFAMLLLVSCGNIGSGGTGPTVGGEGGSDVGGNEIECEAHIDKNADSKCDECGKALSKKCSWHVDFEKDGYCDRCGRVINVECDEHVDENGDRVCDICEKPVSDPEQCTHADIGGDGRCDFCGTQLAPDCETHVDTDGDKKCDVCGAGLSENCTEHTDVDNNGKCDDCNTIVVFVFDFYAINDLHGKFDDTDSCVGVDELTTYLKNQALTDDNQILLSSGDMWQGSSESNLTKGLIVTDWMNGLGFASMTLGNHEYDWGAEYIKENAKLAEFPLLAINVVYKATGERVEYCEASVMVERSGVKIGIIGAIGDCYSSISSSKVTDVEFKVGSELTQLIKAESKRLREAGAEFIVLSLHDGNENSSYGVTNVPSGEMSYYYDTALSEGYVDLVFEGHTHQSYINHDDKGVLHLQAGGYDNGISHVELRLNVANDNRSIEIAEIVQNRQYTSLNDDPVVDELLEKYAEYIAQAYRVLGMNNEYRSASYIKNLVAELYYKAGAERWGEDYDIVLGGGFISTRDPGALYAGEITYSDLVSILPFDNEIVLCKVSGSKLLSQFINSTNYNYFIYYGEYGMSVKNNIDPYATYYIIADSYSSDYAPNGLTVVDRLDSVTFARDLLAQYIEAGGLGDNYKLTSIPDAIAIGEKLEFNADSAEKYYIKGTIISEPNPTYGDTVIRDEYGNELYVYGIRSSSGGLYSSMDNPPKLGDTVILYGVIYHYKNASTGETKVELKSATVISKFD